MNRICIPRCIAKHSPLCFLQIRVRLEVCHWTASQNRAEERDGHMSYISTCLQMPSYSGGAAHAPPPTTDHPLPATWPNIQRHMQHAQGGKNTWPLIKGILGTCGHPLNFLRHADAHGHEARHFHARTFQYRRETITCATYYGKLHLFFARRIFTEINCTA